MSCAAASRAAGIRGDTRPAAVLFLGCVAIIPDGGEATGARLQQDVRQSKPGHFGDGEFPQLSHTVLGVRGAQQGRPGSSSGDDGAVGSVTSLGSNQSECPANSRLLRGL